MNDFILYRIECDKVWDDFIEGYVLKQVCVNNLWFVYDSQIREINKKYKSFKI